MSTVDTQVAAALEIPGQRSVLEPQPVPLPRSLQLKVYGETKDVPIEELIKLAQKGMAADARFQEVAGKEKRLAELEAQDSDFKLMQDGDLDAFRRLGAAAGIPGDYVEEAARAVFENYGDTEEYEEEEEEVDPVTEWRQQRQRGEPRTVGYGDLDPEMRELTYGLVKERTANMIQAGLDNDKVIGYYMKNAKPEHVKAVRDMADELLKGRLALTKGDFTKMGELVPEMVNRLRPLVESFSATRQTNPIGLGGAPGDGIGNAPPTKQPDHVPSFAGINAMGTHLNECIAYEMAKESS